MRPPRYRRPSRLSTLEPFKDEIHELRRRDPKLTGLSSTHSFGGLPLNELVRPSVNLTPISHDIGLNSPYGLRIKVPVLIEQGLADQVVFPAFTQALVSRLTGVGDSVAYHTYPGATHSSVLAVAASDATAFLKTHFGH